MPNDEKQNRQEERGREKFFHFFFKFTLFFFLETLFLSSLSLSLNKEQMLLL